MPKTVADLILEQLAAYGVKHIYGVIGDAIFPLGDALSRQEKISFVPCSIETSAAFMAGNAAKLTGRLGVCTGTSGPGAANLINGVADAFLDNAPLLCITGQVTSDKLGTDYKQYINQTELFQAVTAKSRLCTHPETIILIITSLINQAITLKTAVHLEIPEDILAAQAMSEVVPPPQLMSDLTGTKALYGPLDQALQMMEEAKKPLVVIGKKACSKAAVLNTFAESYGSAIIVSRECKGAVSDLAVRVIGGIGEAYLPDNFLETDLILLFGDAFYEEPFFPSGVPVIRFRNAIQLGSDQYLDVTGDFDLIIRELRNKFPDFIKRDEWYFKIEAAHQERISAADHYPDPKHPLKFFRALSEVVSDDAIITLDVGEFVYWFDLGFLAKKQQVLLSTNWRSMGGGIPAGIAACLENPGRQVITLVGDGGFLMSMTELATIERYQLPLIVFILKNECYGLEVQKMSKQSYKPFATDLVLPDLPKLAEAFGIKGYQLNDLSNKEELRQFIQSPPVLVEVPVNPAALPNL